MNSKNRKIFMSKYKKKVEMEYAHLIKENFRENVVRELIDKNNFKFKGAFSSEYLGYLKMIGGSISGKTGNFYERRLQTVFDILDEMGLTHRAELCTEDFLRKLDLKYSKSVKNSKITNIHFTLPKETKEQLLVMSRELYDEDNVRRLFTSRLQEIFDSLKTNFGKNEVVFKRDIDHCISLKNGKIFLVESKTSERNQDFNAFGDVNKTLETWAGLTYALLKKYKKDSQSVPKPTWNYISILYLMNEKDNNSVKKDISYFPSFYINNLNKGGTISAVEFYKYFLDVNFEDILVVEQFCAGFVNNFVKESLDFVYSTFCKEKETLHKEYEEYISSI